MWIRPINHAGYIRISEIGDLQSSSKINGFEDVSGTRLIDQQIVAMSSTIIPADHGMYVLSFTYEELKFYKLSIIAWAISSSGDTYPITIDGIDLDNDMIFNERSGLVDTANRFCNLTWDEALQHCIEEEVQK